MELSKTHRDHVVYPEVERRQSECWEEEKEGIPLIEPDELLTGEHFCACPNTHVPGLAYPQFLFDFIHVYQPVIQRMKSVSVKNRFWSEARKAKMDTDKFMMMKIAELTKLPMAWYSSHLHFDWLLPRWQRLKFLHHSTQWSWNASMFHSQPYLTTNRAPCTQESPAVAW